MTASERRPIVDIGSLEVVVEKALNKPLQIRIYLSKSCIRLTCGLHGLGGHRLHKPNLNKHWIDLFVYQIELAAAVLQRGAGSGETS
jgi:hypothetical protein